MSDTLPHRTQSVCPVCLARVDAVYTERDGRVWFEKTCPEHGPFAAEVWDDAAGFAAWRRFGPAQPPQNPAAPVEKGCPYDCGLCAGHQQASCCVLLEVTARCNLACPVCYAGAGAGAAPADPHPDTIAGWYDMLLAHGGPFNIQLSGGEPTLRDDLADIIKLGKEKGFTFFQLNTNGLRLAEEPAYLERLAKAGLSTVFLQFDSLRGAACTALRGRDIVAEKKRAIQNCAAAGVGVVLVPTVAAGVNLDDMGPLLDFAASQMPAVRGVHFQPVSLFGRTGPLNGGQRVTVPGLLKALEAQTGGRVKPQHFAPGSAEHPMCTFHADYEISGPIWRAAAPTGGSCCCGTPSSTLAQTSVARKWSAAPAPLPAAGAGLGGKYDLTALDDFLVKKQIRTLALSGMAFQDGWTLDTERLRRCHVHVVSPRGTLVPFCAYNLTGAGGRGLHRSHTPAE